MSRIYTECADGAVLEKRSLGERGASRRNRCIIRRLSPSKRAIYFDMKKDGKSESEILSRMCTHSPRSDRILSDSPTESDLNPSALNKEQTVRLIGLLVGNKMPSLSSMTPEDLRMLLAHLLT
jgi:hypothetical protein